MPELNSTLLLEVALDLANSITNEDRFDRLLSSIRKAINCEAVVLLVNRGEQLTPLATQGLAPDTLGRRFKLSDHPRLALICAASQPVRFPSDSPLADPYDGLLLAKDGDLPVHSCMGLPLYSDNKLIGVVTLDSLRPNAFNDISDRTLQLISALSAATLKTAIQLKALEQRAQQAQDLLQELTHEALTRDGGELIGNSPSMQALKSEIQLVARSDYTVLVLGETGVGKELVARTLHRCSERSNHPLIHLNCASIPETLAESELFGHAKGAFSGAEKERPGKFQLADGGTIFLDEVGELPLSVQGKLLRVLQSGEIQPVGKDQVSMVNVRVIAATNRDLAEEVKVGRFRADLYHRLSVYPVRIPSLKERNNDILLLAGYFLEVTARKLGVRQLKIRPDIENALLEYTWPGNVRELEHVISRASLKATRHAQQQDIISISLADLDFETGLAQPPQLKPKEALATHLKEQIPLKSLTEDFQRQHISDALVVHDGNWTNAAKQLGMDRANLARLAKRLGVSLEKHIKQQTRFL
ncbi:nitric oxide reductase transcriptional regulator NorR [Paraglaciecola chathamensis]|uniref:nitric oxide reductase transcriptional regulator NorR n=1 Tax=Paraglaciecola chathamensis TaxID=368405 RepID=UPI00270F6AFC|nr:nitric oxide reductase transcriptional regulator NorR [Paraglaciecola chathamensis]MDO6558888.1 nitric oxide reductase transcriptional regulator NorR [Paraglaciecola chathamensis]